VSAASGRYAVSVVWLNAVLRILNKFSREHRYPVQEKLHKEYIQETIRLAEQSIDEGGGPFGAIIVHNGKIIGRGMNCVTKEHDPTAHAEIKAIRDACQALNRYSLDDCVIYVNCQPCPMCLSAIYWARLDELYYAATDADAAEAGFDDQLVATEVRKDLRQQKITSHQLFRDEAIGTFERWKAMPDKIEY
jgi:guanine deaminase